MVFAGINYLAVLVAAIVSFPLGAVWYRVFAKPWLAALGKTEADLKASPAPYVIAFLAQLVMAWSLAGLIGHMGSVTARSGLITGFFVWLGFVITTMIINNAFSGHKPTLTAINGGYWLLVFLVQGLIIGLFGVR